jgi:dephospho-CoA kinase
MRHTINVNRKVSVVKIALTGKLRAGKDEVAQHLYIRHGFDRVAFGDALKRNAHAVFPWISDGTKPRALYQKFGQLMRQEFDEDVWVKHAEQAVKGAIDFRVSMGAERVGIVLTDVRQQNEVAWCRENGFTLIRVTAPDDVRIARAIEAGDDFTVHDLVHSTELATDGFAVDYEIVNDGSVDDLKAQIDAILTSIQTGVPTYVNNNGATVFLPDINEINGVK